MDDPGTDSLRKMAPNWTLAGDEQLLSILQNTHQKLLSKCQEANSQLEQMATALNDATISLQNVNNQFMALSSSQFIESRVYDDDDLATDVPVVKEQPKPEIPDELTSLKRSISVLENAHEVITILQDSDSESDTDDDMPARMVLKPKDMYASRPLPYIIGTQPWKNRWHAGLLLEDSDSDSTASKVEHDSDQYSLSEPEDNTDKLPVPHTHTQTTVSETSSELRSELPSEQGSVPKPTPSDVASEIARRLGAGREPPKMVEREPEDDEPPKPTVRKIYRPQEPVSSTIFPDEPPPLTPVSDGESDIFAELHRAQPYASANVPDELFADDRESDEGDIFSDFAKKPATNPSAKPTSLFDSGPTPHMFVKHNDNRHTSDDHRGNIRDDHHRRNVYDDDDDRGRNDGGGREVYDEQRGDAEAERVKKPIGGISLFGNKGTESIGAAILKRNQRKASTSGDDSESDSRSESHSNQQIRKEKDIFDDLFARSESKNVKKDKDFSKDLKTQIQKKTEVKEKMVEKPKVDLFSDNLFDDIDDIFTTNVVKMPAKDNSKSKSIFEDDDDLFSEIAAPKPMKIEVASSSNNKKSLFDSDDELFSETKPVEKPKETSKPVEVIKPKVAERTKIETNKTKEITQSIFDDDEDDLFSETNKIQNNKPVSIEKPQDFGKEDTKNTAPTKSLGNDNVSRNFAPTISNVFKSPTLFDDDEDESDLFAKPAKSYVQNVKAASIKDTTKLSSKSDIDTTEEKVDERPSSKSEENIHKDNFVIPTSLVKNGKYSEKVDIVNKDSSKALVDNIFNTSETHQSLKDEEYSSVSSVSKNVDSMKGNVATNAAKIFEHLHKNIEESSSETNNDFSDQDFDDLPPKEEEPDKTVISNNYETEETTTGKPNIFDKTTLEEDIDELFTTAQQKSDNTETIFKNIIPDYTETLPEKTEQDNKTAEIATKTIEADIFSNIITEPPVFEKPKEPKKSKNVNALFDDDSDDESLFFKKNDPIFVENPQEFTPTQDRIFGLFTDEPPDDGFSKLSDEFDDDMFSTLPKPRVPQNQYPPIPDTVLFEDSTATGNIIPEIEKVDRRNDNKIPEVAKADSVEEIFIDSPKGDEPPSEITKEPKSEDIFKLLTTENVDEGQKSSTVFSDDEQLFKEPTPALQGKSSLDFLSDEEDLFATGPPLENPPSLSSTKIIEPIPENKKPILKDNPTLDLSDDDNLFSSVPKFDKPLAQDNPVPDNKKPTLKDKPAPDLSDDENIFASVPTLEKPSLPSTKPEKPIPKNKNITFENKPSADLSDDENLFGSGPALDKPGNKNLESVSKSSDEELFTSFKTEKPKLTETKLHKQDSRSDEDMFKKPEFAPKSVEIASESKPEKSEKKVGKLKVGLNINVNALLPGASPKKVKLNDQPDGQSESVAESQKAVPKVNPEVPKSESRTENQNTDSKLLKSVSFEGEPESDVLNNKLSKERAKIQVKRRPSTRRARREAVRKSGIDFGEDSTDNSSSIDDPPRKHHAVSKKELKPIEIKQDNQPEIIDNLNVQTKLDDTPLKAKIDPVPVEKQPTIETTTIARQPEITERPSFSRDVKSKVVYILNDEDIFNTSPVEKPESLNTNLDSNTGVTTLGKVYDNTVESNTKKGPKSSLFGADTDEEIFKAKTAVKKSTIFNSDSEEELFGTSKREEKEKSVEKIEVKKEIKREVVKGSLFGDDDDDDDLFGVKTKKVVDPKPQPSRSTAVKETKEAPKLAEPVFEDPLSMFGDDD